MERNHVKIPSTVGFLDLSGAEDYDIAKTLLRRGIQGYEPEVFAAMAALIETSGPPTRLLDIGANIGIFGLAMAAIFGSRVRVTAFEPEPGLAMSLVRTAANNGVQIDVRQCAMGRRVETARFYLSKKSDASNSLNARFRAHRDVIDVEVVTLESFFDSAVVPFVLKIDTESTEPDVLAGGRKFIEFHRPSIICEVLAGRTEKQLQEFFLPLDYVPVHLTSAPAWEGSWEVVGDRTYKHRDWLFLPCAASQALEESFVRWYEKFSR